MKKISISIPNPCHENWNEMTPKDQGRFCGSCQKTVVDFSQMSDRQIAEFFRKPAGSTCGRFHSDQLGREMVVPKRSIPWSQYLFKATWPAFVLFLKSCTDRQSTLGKIEITAPAKHDRGEQSYTTVGLMLSEITPVDTAKEIIQQPVKVEVMPTHTVGMIAPPTPVIGDTIINAFDPVEETLPPKKSCRPFDTVMDTNYTTYQKGEIVTGATSVITTKTLTKDVVNKKEVEEFDYSINAYPNPVKSGGRLTINLPLKGVIRQIQLVATSGASIPLASNLATENGVINVTIPGGLAAGAYYLQIVTNNQKAKTVKLIVLN